MRKRLFIFFLLVIHSGSTFCESPEWIYEHVSPSVVTVVASNLADQGTIFYGSGVVLEGKKVVTNCHVVEKSTIFVVVQHEKVFRATGLTRHRFADICLLHVPTLPFPAISKFKPISQVKVGQRVYAIGSPSGLELTLSDGLISGLRKMPVDETKSPGQMQPIVQTTAAIEHGSSGGGLFDDSGALVGITTFGRTEGSQYFAIPIDRVTELLQPSTSVGQYEPLSASAKAALGPNGEYRGTPHLVFDNAEVGKQWLDEMSKRLEKNIPDPISRQDFLVTLQYEAMRAGLDPQLILAMIDVLSHFRKYAVGKYGEQGYMQVRQEWKEKIGDENQNLFNLRTNLRYGCTIIRHFLALENGDTSRALGRYNADRLLGSGVKIDDRSFSDQVLRAWARSWDYAKTRFQVPIQNGKVSN